MHLFYLLLCCSALVIDERTFTIAGGRWDYFRGPHQASGQGVVPPRFDVDRPRHGTNMPRDYSVPTRGPPYLPEEEFGRPYGGRPYEDPYTYGDTSRGMKRPYFAVTSSLFSV